MNPLSLDAILATIPEEDRPQANLVLGQVWASAYGDKDHAQRLEITRRAYAFNATMEYLRRENNG